MPRYHQGSANFSCSLKRNGSRDCQARRFGSRKVANTEADSTICCVEPMSIKRIPTRIEKQRKAARELVRPGGFSILTFYLFFGAPAVAP